MITSNSLWKADQNIGKDLLEFLKDPIENLKFIEAYTEHFKRKSTVPKKINYFRDYEQGIQMYRDIANVLNILIQELKDDRLLNRIL